VKVLMLGWELPPHHTGGLGIACYQMAKYLSQAGVDIEFILPYDAEFNIDFMKVTPAHPQSVLEILRAGGVYDSGKYELVFSDGTSEITDLRNQQDKYESCVAKMVKYAEFDILHAHDWLTFRAAMAAKRVTGKPLIVHVHATEYDRSGRNSGNPMVRDIEYNGLMMADKVLAVSQTTKDTITRIYGIDPDKIEVVHNSLEIDPSNINESANAYHYLEVMKQNGYKVVLSAGRLTIQKGINFLMEAAVEVIRRNPKVLFLYVGSGEHYEEMIELAANLGISKNVLFTGFLNGTGKEWRDSFRVADLFVMPSVSEPFGITPLEAIGYGTPVLISKQSGVSEVLNHALKVDFWDTHEMANQILAVLNNSGLARTLLENSQAEYRELSWRDSALKMIDIYNRHLWGANS
jgi:glycosyltransferase involved in cell wall biosynthesis